MNRDKQPYVGIVDKRSFQFIIEWLYLSVDSGDCHGSGHSNKTGCVEEGRDQEMLRYQCDNMFPRAWNLNLWAGKESIIYLH